MPTVNLDRLAREMRVNAGRLVLTEGARGWEMRSAVSFARPAEPSSAGVPMVAIDIVIALFAIAKAHRLSTTDLACLCGVSAQTIRFCELTGRPPVRRPQREAITRFVARSRTAQKRSELHLEDLAVNP